MAQHVAAGCNVAGTQLDVALIRMQLPFKWKPPSKNLKESPAIGVVVVVVVAGRYGQQQQQINFFWKGVVEQVKNDEEEEEEEEEKERGGGGGGGGETIETYNSAVNFIGY